MWSEDGEPYVRFRTYQAYRSRDRHAALKVADLGHSYAAVAALATDWPDALFAALLEAGIRTVAYVPDAGHARVIELAHAEESIIAVPLTTEEEGIGYLAGAWLGGMRGVLLMQSSGVGNCINTLALAAQARFPLLMLVTMRGEWAELNPWQNPAGGAAAHEPRADGRAHVARRSRRGRRAARARRARDDVRGRHEQRGPARTAPDRGQGLVTAER